MAIIRERYYLVDVLNQKYCLYFLSELSVLSIIGLELETNGIMHCA